MNSILPRQIHLLINSLALVLFTLIISSCGIGEQGDSTTSNNSPQGLISNSGSRIVELSWNGLPSATSYTVYWSNNKNVDRDTAGTIQTIKPYFKHQGLANGLYYYYIVSANTGVGESATSQEVMGSPEAAPPALVENINLQPGDQRITVNFEQSLGATSYSLYWSTDNSENNTTNLFEQLNRIDSILPPFVHTDLINGTTYHYWIVANNALEKKSISEELTVTPQKSLPTAPIITEALIEKDQVILTWSDVSNAENFNLYWGTEQGIDKSNSLIANISSPYTYSIPQAVDGTQYFFKIIAKNSAGESDLSNEANITFPDTISISNSGTLQNAPKLRDEKGNALVSLDIADRQITLNWPYNENNEVRGFNLYWKKGSATLDTEINITTDDFEQKIVNIQPPYTHIGLQNNNYYYYRISAISNNGESPLTELPLIIGKPEVIVPGIPSGVTAISGDNNITISWNPVLDAESYNVTITENDAIIDYPNVQSPFVLSDLENGTIYKVSVYVVNGTKAGKASEAIELSPKEPVVNAPEMLTASPGNHQITLRWNSAKQKNVDDEKEAVKNYRVYYRYRSGVTPANAKEIEGLTFTKLKDSDQWQTTITNLSNGQRYYYIVTAINAGGESQVSPQAWAQPQKEIPNAPKNLYAEAGDNQVTIRFTGVENESTPVYNLYWSKETTDGRSDTQVITNISQNPPYVFTDGASNGKNYFFKVSATNLGGESTLSSEVSAMPRVNAPSAVPSNIDVTANNRIVSINWQNSPNATSYNIYWSTKPEVNAGNRVKVLASDGSTGFKHKNLTNGETYYYRLSAVNAGGEGPLSSISVAQPQINPPSVPIGLKLEAGNSKITVEWSRDTKNKNAKTVSYNLYWHDSRKAPISEWRLERGIQPGFILNKLTNKTTYHFRLVAINAGGKSPLSTTKSATPIKETIAAPNAPTGISLTPGDSQLVLNWSANTELTYTVYWSIDSNTPFDNGIREDNISPPWTHGEINPLQNDKRYYYQITATNNGGESSPSSIVSTMPRKPIVNRQPVFSRLPNLINAEGSTITPFSVTATDADEDTLIYSASGYPKGISFNTKNAQFSGTLATDSKQDNKYIVIITVNDQSGEINARISSSFSWLIYDAVADPSQSSVTISPSNSSEVKQPLLFTIIAKDRLSIQRSIGGDKVTVSIQGANESLTLSPVVDNLDGTYQFSYTPTALGQDNYSIMINGIAIGGGPYRRIIAVPDVVIEKTQMTVSDGPFTAGDTVSLTAQLFDKDDGITTAASVVFTISGANTQNIDASYNETTQTYEASFQATTSGTDDIKLSINGAEVTSLSFTRLVSAAALDITKTTMTIIPSNYSITTDETINVTVSTQDAFGNNVYDANNVITITLPYANKALTLPAITDNNNGTYTVNYQPEKIGTEYINLDVNAGTFTLSEYRNIIGGSPILSTLEVNIPTGPLSILHGYNLSATLLDQFGNVTTVNAVFQINGVNTQQLSASFRYDSAISSYTNYATFTPTILGSDTITLSIDDIIVSSVNEIRTIGPNRKPIASAGADFVATRGTTVQLNGDHSTDPEGRPMTYTWVFTNKPSGSSAELDSLTSTQPSFIADQLGTYSFSLVANDGFDGSTNTATLDIIARDPHKLDAPNTLAIPYEIATVVANDNGDLLAVWLMQNGKSVKMVASYKPVAGQWSAETSITTNSYNYKLASNGSTFMLVYDTNYRISAKEFDGSNWSDTLFIDSYYYSGAFQIERIDNNYLFYGVYSYRTLRIRNYQFNDTTNLWEWGDIQDLTTDNSVSRYGIPTLTKDQNGNMMFTWSQSGNINDVYTYELVSIVKENDVWMPPEKHISIPSNVTFKTQAMDLGFMVTWYTYRQELINNVSRNVYDIEATIFSNGTWTTPELLSTSRSPNYEIASNGTSIKIAWSNYTSSTNGSLYDLTIGSANYSNLNDSWIWSQEKIVDNSSSSIYAPAIKSNGNNYLLIWGQNLLNTGYIDQNARVFDLATQLWGPVETIDNVDFNIFGSASIETNNNGYIAAWAQYDSTNSQQLYANVYELNSTTNSFTWSDAKLLSTDNTNYGVSNIEILTNGIGYAIKWDKSKYLNGEYIYGYYINTYGNPGLAKTWGTTREIDSGSVNSLKTTKLINLPNGEYQITWLDSLNLKKALFTDNLNGIDNIAGTNLVQNKHEGSVIEVKSNTNVNGNTLVISKQYHDGRHQLYGQFFRNNNWELQFLIADDVNTFEIKSIGTDFFIVYDASITGNYSYRNIYTATYSESLGLNTAIQLNTVQFYRGSYFTWDISANANNIAVIWGRNGLYTSVYSDSSSQWSTATNLQTTPANISSASIATDGVGFGVTWVSNGGGSRNGYANIYSSGMWQGEQLIESATESVGNRDYSGAPVIASNGSSYMTLWAQNNIDNTAASIYTNQLDISTLLWGSPTLLGEAATYIIYPSISATNSDYAISWTNYLASYTGVYNRFYQKDPISGTYSWSNAEQSTCGKILTVTNNKFAQSCSYYVHFREYNNQLNSWQWIEQSRYPSYISSSNFAFNDAGNYAGFYNQYSSALRKSLNKFIIYDLVTGWDTGRELNLPTSTVNNYQSKVFNAGNRFAAQWFQTNEIDDSLQNAWIMTDL